MTLRRIIVGAAVVFAVTAVAYLFSRPVPAQLAPGPGFGDVPRVRNPLDNKVVEVGSIESAASVELRSNLKEPTSILFVIAEGTHVKSGDVVVRLDSASLESEQSKQKIALANAESELLNAEAELDAARELQKVLGRADEARVKAAIRRHASYLAEGGEFALKADRLNVELNLAKTRAEFATKKLKRLERSAEDVNDLEAARLELSEARAEITSLEADLRLLEQHEKPAEAAEREVAVLTAQAKKIRNRAELNKRVQLARSHLAAAKTTLDLARRELETLQEQIDACVIKSPQAGIVVYANQFSSRGAAAFQVEEGAIVRPRQTIIHLPDMSRLQLRVAVNETKIAKIRPGQSVSIQVDAFADAQLKGRVTKVNQYAEPASFASAGVKQFAVFVSIIDPPKSVRLGMTAFAEIDVREKE